MAISDELWDPAKAVQDLALERDVLDSTQETQARQLFTDNLPIAAARIVQLSQWATSEAVALQASKFIYDQCLGKDGKGGKDALDALIEEFQKASSEN